MKKTKEGFTLVEVLIVVSIIAILSIIVMVAASTVRKRSYVSRTKADLEQIALAIDILTSDSGLQPNKSPINPCIKQAPPVDLENCTSGLKCTDGGFPNWKGPYSKNELIDVWGSDYILDTNYICNGQEGCQNHPMGTKVRAIVSSGQNKTFNNDDDIVYIVCE